RPTLTDGTRVPLRGRRSSLVPGARCQVSPEPLPRAPTADSRHGPRGTSSVVYRNEFEVIPEAEARRGFPRQGTDPLKCCNTVLSAAGRFEVDAVIDPVDTRRLPPSVARLLVLAPRAVRPPRVPSLLSACSA